jgi:hypothetical protein
LVYALAEFRNLEINLDNDADPEELSVCLEETVGALDPTPFTDEDSPWNL